jgi:hypothetical protein
VQTAADIARTRLRPDRFFFPAEVLSAPLSCAKRVWLYERHQGLKAIEELLLARTDPGLAGQPDKRRLLIQLTNDYMVSSRHLVYCRGLARQQRGGRGKAAPQPFRLAMSARAVSVCICARPRRGCRRCACTATAACLQ